MDGFLQWLQNLPVFVAIAESSSVWAYPTVLMLHTVGLGWLVGLNVLVDLRLLGVGRGVPAAVLQSLFPKMMWGFWVNLTTGLILFALDATHKAHQWIFWVKLALVAVAMFNIRQTRLYLAANQTLPVAGPMPARARGYAWVSLVLWWAATATGRLMAYVG